MFDSSALVQAWLHVEQTLARAEAEVGVIPAASDRIEREAVADLYDLDETRAGVFESQHPLARALTERCGDAGGFVHWGATTQDVVDTGLVLQVRTALVPVRRDLRRSAASSRSSPESSRASSWTAAGCVPTSTSRAGRSSRRRP